MSAYPPPVLHNDVLNTVFNPDDFINQNDTGEYLPLIGGTISGALKVLGTTTLTGATTSSALITTTDLRVNNPSIWRPIYHIQDACTAFIRAIQAPSQISGVYNVASDNYTLGQIGDVVSNEIQKLSGREINVEIDNIEDFRNYKVSIEKAKNQLGFSPSFGLTDIVQDLYNHIEEYGDMTSDKYYNVNIFKKLGK